MTSAARTPVIFDTDPGIDDAMALFYLAALPQAEMLGVTTVCGNASIEHCTRNALYLKERFGLAAPVYKGAGKPLLGGRNDSYPDFVHGRNGLGEVAVKVDAARCEAAAADDFIVEAAKAHSGELVIIAVGRLTNLAKAFAKAPRLKDELRALVVMGGAYKTKGNVTPYAEANIFGDPEAAEAVFRSGAPLTMVGLDVTFATMMDDAYLDSLCGQLGETGSFLRKIAEFYMGHHKNNLQLSSFPVHDSSAIAYFDQPQLFTVERGSLSCQLNGEERGRTLFTPDPQGPHQVCATVQSAALLARYAEAMTACWGRPPSQP